jgi:aldehyde dehydrogenase (NAD+)
VGRIIRQETAGTGKHLSLELGGKSPFVVYEDADLDSVVEGVVDAIWFNQGQVCCADSRLLVKDGINERVVNKLRARMEKLRVGNPLDKAIDIGAIVAPVQLQRIEALVKKGQEEGATLWQPSWSCPEEGCFYPPTLFTDVSPASTIAQVEIFGPVVVLMTFRTPGEAVALANNTPYGLAASVWTENVNLALDVAPAIRAGTVWVNSTNLFDAASGFGGYRESGFGREGGREGMLEYLTPAAAKKATAIEPWPFPGGAGLRETGDGTFIDRTPKLFIGGKQVRPDGNYSYPVHDAKGRLAGEAGLGNRKDVRDAVAAAKKSGWAAATAHNRAQVLFFLAENLAIRADEFAARIAALTGASAKAARAEVDASIERIFAAAGMADKFEGSVHQPPMRTIALALHEPVGALGIIAPDEQPLLGLVAMIAPALAMGNSVVAVPSPRHALVATDLYQVFETSDLPAGAVNIVTGKPAELATVLAKHDDLDGLWCVADADTCRMVEFESAGNLKRVWTAQGRMVDWNGPQNGLRAFLRRAVEVKNVWVPYGD